MVGSGVERGTGVGAGATALETSLPPVLGAAVGAGAAGVSVAESSPQATANRSRKGTRNNSAFKKILGWGPGRNFACTNGATYCQCKIERQAVSFEAPKAELHGGLPLPIVRTLDILQILAR